MTDKAMSLETQLQQRLDSLAKPPGSLGKLEALALQLGSAQHTMHPSATPRRLCIFAADHAVAAAGVTLWPSAVTDVIVRAIVGGHAGSSALARSSDTQLRLIDVGTFGDDLGVVLHYRCAKVRAGCRNILVEPGLTAVEFEQAWRVGVEEAHRAVADGCKVLAVGEVGIGNTTSASAVAVLLGGLTVEEAVGHGAGSTPESFARKRDVVALAVDRARLQLNPTAGIAAVCGLELAAMAGYIVRASQSPVAVVLDGFVTAAAALIAETLHPHSTRGCLASHCGAEQGHARLLSVLHLAPYLTDWQLRLGEGTGALLLLPMLDAATSLVNTMATLAELGVRA